ncbi:MAG: Hypoxanthine/guanine phosphoribosyltransferase [Methanomassiliicoccales archaeon PtaU1.Bin030]|nr:MAG: Hypoxanthine/guanine phosphoribosyltransferase [Methanomassiliicoccales archaeon PtaU1.Bin030]
MLDKLKQSLLESPVVRMGDYSYFVHPITDGIPCMEPAILQEVIDRIMEIGDLRCDRLVTAEAMGIPLVAPISLLTGIPYNIVRKRQYGLPGEVCVTQVTGYSRKELYINGLGRGDRVVVMDDVISTGGTLRAIIKAFQGMGVEVVDVIVVVEKGEGRAELERELGIRIKTLVKVDVRDGRTIVLD